MSLRKGMIFSLIFVLISFWLSMNSVSEAQPFTYIPKFDDGTVSVIDTETDTVISTVAVAVEPTSAAAHPDGNRVYVTHGQAGGNIISLIDPFTNTTVSTFSSGGLNPVGAAIHPDGTRLYVTNSGNGVLTVIDTATQQVTATVQGLNSPLGVTVHPDGTRVYVANNGIGQPVSVIDAATNTVIATVGMGNPALLSILPNGSKLYVTNTNNNQVSVVDTATNTVKATINVGLQPYGVAPHPDGTKVYVGNLGDNTISVIDTTTDTVIATIPVAARPCHVAVHPDGTRVYVAHDLSTGNNISVISTVTNAVIGTIKAGSSPQGLAFSIPNEIIKLLGSAGPDYWAVLGLGGNGTSLSMSGSASVTGTVANVGVAKTGSVNMSGSSTIQGTLFLNTAGSLNKSGSASIAGGVKKDAATDAMLNQVVADAKAASQTAASLPATITSPTNVTISNPSQNITVTGGLKTNVWKLTNVAISNGTLTLSAPSGGQFIINVSGNFSLSGGSKIVLAGGLTPYDVLFNFTGTGNVALSGGAAVSGIILASQRGISLSSGVITGEVISGGSQIANSGGQINNLEQFKATISAVPILGSAPLQVQFNAMVQGGIPPYTYAWDLDGNGTTDDTRQAFTYTYQQSGIYHVTLRVNDSKGNSVSATVVINATMTNRNPIANPGGPYSGSINAPVQFDGSGSSDPDGDPITYSWNFGDGATGSGVNPVHAYANVGTYTVSLTVYDNRGGSGTAQTTTQINNFIPTIFSISPSSKTYGNPGFTMTVYGTNFVPGSVVNFNGSVRATTFLSTTQLTASILASDLNAAGSFPITVSNPAPGGGTSNALSFTVNMALPTITVTGGTFPYDGSVHPASATATGVGGSTVSGSFSYTYNGLPAGPVDAGSYSVVANFTSSDPNYTNATGNGSIVITPANQTISFGALPDKTFDDSPFAVSATASSTLTVSFASQTPLTCSVSGTTVTILDVGVCTIRASQGGNSDYNAAPPVDESFNVTPGALDHFGIAAISSPQTAGTAFPIAITAQDKGNHTVTSFNGTVEITSTGTFSSGGGTSEALVNGVLASHSVRILNTGSFTITATRTGGTEAGTSNTFTVNPGALSSFLVEASGGGSLAPQTAGTPFSIQITARDQYNNTVKTFTGTVQITSNGVLLGTPLTSGAFVSGVLTSQSITITSAQLGTTLSATDTVSGANGTSNGFTVNPAGLGNFLIEASAGGSIGPQTAGVPFGIKVTARDPYNNVIPSFSGGVTLQAEIGSISPSSVTFYGNEEGSLTVDVTLTQEATPQTITAISGGHQGSSNDFTVNPAGLGNFLIEASAGGNIAPQTVGAPFGIRITARDAYNNVITTFSGTVALSTNAGTITPSSITFTGNEGGVLTTNVTVTQSGVNETITASFDIYSGQSNAFTVNAGPLDHFKVEAAGGGNIPDQTAWVSFSIQITAQDANNNTVTAFNGTVDITSAGNLALGGGTTEAFANGVLASHSVAISVGGSFTITATRTGGTEIGTSNTFTVMDPAPILSSINPTSITAGSPDFFLTLTGDNFLTTSVVSFNNQQVSSQYISKTQLQATIPAAAVTTAGSYPVKVVNPAPGGGSAAPLAFAVSNPAPSLTSMNPSSITAGSPDFTLTLTGDNFSTTSIVSFNNQQVSSQYISKTQLQATIPSTAVATAGSYPVKVTNPAPGGGNTTPLAFAVLAVLNPVPSLSSINPTSIIAGSPDFTLTLTGDNFLTTSIVSFNNQQYAATFISKNQITAIIPSSAIVTAGNYPVKVTNRSPGGGESPSLTFTVNPSHPNVAPQPEGSFGQQYQDLIPPNATIQSYDPKRFSLITGLVKDLAGSPITNVSVNILGRIEYGTAKTNTEGRFSIPVEGGGTLTVTYKKDGLITTHRKVYVPWNDIAIAETITMIPEDMKSATLTFDGNPNTIVTHQSTIVIDDRGSRSSTIVFSGDNRAYSVDAQGNVIQELTTITTRATEFTTPDSMPAKLPPNSAYTYCVELSVDGAQRVRFDKPVVLWVDNFLGFNVGEVVPVGYYDRDRGVWVPSDNGRVVRLLDTDGDGIVDTYDDVGDGQPHGGVTGLNDPTIYKPGSTYWRVSVAHFTPWDPNWPYGPPGDSISPNGNGVSEADQQEREEEDCRKSTSSFIEERSRIFHEDILIPGTNMTFHYTSNRVKGYFDKITIPVSGDNLPASLREIIVQVNIAGRFFEQTLAPLPNQKTEFVWDGLDYLGRSVDGRATAYINIGFVYDAVYYSTYESLMRAFAQPGRYITGTPTRQGVISWSKAVIQLAKTKGDIAEGWTISIHHQLSSVDPSKLYKGDGTMIVNSTGLIKTVAGNGSSSYSGDGGPASQASLSSPGGATVDALGSIYFPDTYNHRVRKIDPSGIITTVAGNGIVGYSGDGGPATQASLYYPSGVTVDASGNIYIADTNNNRIRRVDPSGIITTVAGNGIVGYSGDGGPATQASFYYPRSVALDASDSLYIADRYSPVLPNSSFSAVSANGTSSYNGNGVPTTKADLSSPSDVKANASFGPHIPRPNIEHIRKIDPSGIITTVAGNGIVGYSGDGGPATQASLNNPSGVTVDASGNIYIADTNNNRIRRIDPSGKITTVAGNGIVGYGGDGGPATQASLNNPSGVTVDASGNIYIADTKNNRIRRIDPSGIIATVAGNGSSDYNGDGWPATQTSFSYPSGVTVDASGNIYIADTNNNRIRKVGTPSALESIVNVEGDITFAEDNSLSHIFSTSGRHKSTIDLDTRLTLYTFGYDQNNKLVSITDQFGNMTTIQRDAGGMATAITSPDGLTTTLTIDANNNLTRITYPDTSFYTFEYTSGGLMAAKIEPEGNRFEHTFDSIGRLTDATDQEEGHWQYSRTTFTNGNIQTDVLSAEGNLTFYLDHTDSTGAYTSLITDPSGAETHYSRSADKLTATKSLPCGMGLTFKYGVDSQYKFEFVKEMSEKTASGLEKITLQERTYQDTNADNTIDLITEKLTLNGKLTTLLTDTLQSKKTLTSPVGRTTTTFYDSNNLLTTKLTIPALYDTNFGYDTRGRLTSINTDIRQTTFTYDPQGNLSSITDPENRTTTYSYDAVGRMKGILRPDSSSVSLTYDKNGNMTVLTNPSTINHGFGYNKVNLESSYQTPLSGSYSYSYNRDRRLLQINFPSGKQIKNIYDKDRIIQTQTPEGNIDFTYLCGSKVGSITKGTEIITYGYDGSLITSETLSGTLNQSINYTYNNDFNLMSFIYAGSTVNYSYDNDGLLTGAGAFTITRNAGNGLPGAVTGGALNLTRTFNGYGEVERENFTVNGQNIDSWNLTRDNAGRIILKTETVQGTTSNYAYTYDSMGRLLTVTKDSALSEEYRYDSIGRRTYEMNVPKGISGRTFAYSNEDHLLTAGDTTYQYDADGFLTTKTHGSNITRYSYASRGDLLSVNLPDGEVFEYINDPSGRRIVKKVDGIITEKYLWQGLTRLLAVYDGSNNLIMRFEYADAPMPVALTSGGVTYYLTYDQVGSLRVVSDASGNVVKKIDHDSFGSIISDTNPSFTVPSGFAGGLYDPDTGLVRFGFRDYDPDTGRWTAKDPVLFAGGEMDIYGYVQNNPINFIDPLGLATYIELPPAGSPGRYWWDFGGGIGDFWRNYWDMRNANTIGADKYFHCMANCEASRRGLGGSDAARSISEIRELIDEYIKGDPRWACDQDRSANQQGQQGDPTKSCKDVCKSLRPRGLHPKY